MIDVFLEELAPSGMHLDRQPAGELIAGQVRAVATLMRVTEATARTYLGDEIINRAGTCRAVAPSCGPPACTAPANPAATFRGPGRLSASRSAG
jgi:hypothetical protein